MVDFWADWAAKYPIGSLEDGLAEDDWLGWKLLTERLGEHGPAGRRRHLRDQPGAPGARDSKRTAPTPSSIKLNQIGTVTETLQVVETAQRHGWGTVISHRSGETEDTTIADLAVATAAGPDQERGTVPLRAGRQVQPAAAHRGRARSLRCLPGQVRHRHEPVTSTLHRKPGAA